MAASDRPANEAPPRADPTLPSVAPATRRLQMADIARMAGVSTTTVSRALSGSALVNEETRKRVTELARSLHYTVNAGAKELRLGHSNTVAVVVPASLALRQAMSDPFFLGLFGSVADALTDRGYDTLFSRIHEDNLRLASTPYDSGRAMGIILIGPWSQPDPLNQLAARGVPLVVWGTQVPQQLYCTVGCDHVEGGRLAVRHLLAQGRRRIALVGELESPEGAQRYQGYQEALAEAGLAADPALRARPWRGAEAGREALAQLRAGSAAFDALFAGSELLALSAIGALRDAGLRVPQDVAVVGYGDTLLADTVHPPLTTVRLPIDAGGRALVASLLSFLDHAPPRSQVLPAELIVRASG